MPKDKSAPRYRSLFVVIQKQTFDAHPFLQYENLEKYVKDKFKAEYFCFCEEIGDKTKSEHIHLYIELSNAITFQTVKKKLYSSHVEARSGTPREAREYVFKIGKHANKAHTNTKPPKEYGDFSRFEKRSSSKGKKMSVDKRFKLYLESCNTIEEVEEIDVWFAQSYRRILLPRFEKKRLEQLYEDIGSSKTGSSGKIVTKFNRKIYYLFGSTRVGKTFGVKLKYGSDDVYTANCCIKHPFDGYNGQSILHLDEFRSGLQLQEVLTLLDGHETTLQCRYADKSLLADTIIISTNWALSEQYPKIKEENPRDWKAFANRFVNGVWEMVYSEPDDMRYICCISDKFDYSPASRSLLDFSEPPVDINDTTIHIKNRTLFDDIKKSIDAGKPVAPVIEAYNNPTESDGNAELPF